MLFMRSKFSFLDVDIQFDMTHYKVCLKNRSRKCWLRFHIFFEENTKITFGFNFIDPLATSVKYNVAVKQLVLQLLTLILFNSLNFIYESSSNLE